jgi:hypothetical protein
MSRRIGDGFGCFLGCVLSGEDTENKYEGGGEDMAF